MEKGDGAEGCDTEFIWFCVLHQHSVQLTYMSEREWQMSDLISLPRSSAQWLLENLRLDGMVKVELFQALSKVQLEPQLARAIHQVCEDQLKVLNFGGAGEGSEIVSQLKTVLKQLDEG